MTQRTRFAVWWRIVEVWVLFFKLKTIILFTTFQDEFSTPNGSPAQSDYSPTNLSRKNSVESPGIDPNFLFTFSPKTPDKPNMVISFNDLVKKIETSFSVSWSEKHWKWKFCYFMFSIKQKATIVNWLLWRLHWKSLGKIKKLKVKSLFLTKSSWNLLLIGSMIESICTLVGFPLQNL